MGIYATPKSHISSLKPVTSQRNHRRPLPPAVGCVFPSGCPTAATVTTCTTASRVTLGRTPDTTVSPSGETWHRFTAERRWSSSGTSTTPNITTSGSASPGTTTVSVAKQTIQLLFRHMRTNLCHGLMNLVWLAVGWAWTDKTSLGFVNWAQGEPNAAFHPGDVAEENCVEMYNDGHWNDNNCLQKRGFICQHRKCMEL